MLLHWATADQYYVKSAEHFHDYQFQSRTGVTVRFALEDADVEHDNIKGAHRFFIARDSGTSWDPEARRLVVPFEFRRAHCVRTDALRRAASQQGAVAASRPGARCNSGGPAGSHPECLAALEEQRSVDPGGKTETLLEHHLTQYARRNTSDFFIHKDLSGFLGRELDLYLKNEVLSLDTLEAGGEERADGWFQMMRLLRSVGGRIIEFLGQIEDFQKMLWEKRKFVVETNYLVLVSQISEDLYPENSP